MSLSGYLLQTKDNTDNSISPDNKNQKYKLPKTEREQKFFNYNYFMKKLAGRVNSKEKIKSKSKQITVDNFNDTIWGKNMNSWNFPNFIRNTEHDISPTRYNLN